MKFSVGNESCELSDTLLNAIVCSIDKAVSEDVPNQLRKYPLETNNYISFMRGDFINQNLRQMVNDEGGQLHRFQRFGWSGRILISRESHLTISITTQNNLNTIPRKVRQRPHFMQSLLHCMNDGLHGRYEQISLFDSDPFEEEAYVTDFENIINGVLNADEFRHCVITYCTSGNDLVDVKLVILDPCFNVVTEDSLVEYMKPVFARLTDSAPKEETAREKHNNATRQLTSLKQGVTPALREEEKEA